MKLYSLNCTLQIESSGKKYEEKFVLNVPGDTDRDARDKFLTGINNSQFFISPIGTFWPMYYTRALITSSSEFGTAAKTAPILTPIVTPPVEKKPRKPRGPNKIKAKINEPEKKVKIQQGIAPRKTRGKKV